MNEESFAAALRDPARPVPAGLCDPAGRPAGKRFDVYRNNVASSLTDALVAGFPVIHALVGDAFFRAMAGLFLRAHPPRSGVLALYGDALPGFLEGFEPAASLPFLPDMARLERAVRRAYHAADATPIDPAALTALAPDVLMAVRLRPAPAVGLIVSRWPLATLWLAHQPGGPALPRADAGGEAVLVTRPAFDPVVCALPPGGAAFVAALLAGAPFGTAVEAGASTTGFDVTAALGPLLAGGAIVALDNPTEIRP